jgi:putative redox protein
MKEVTAHVGMEAYETTLTARHHQLISDEPTEYKGGDTGPAPEEYLLMGLASCTAITLRMYANRKGLPIDAFDVSVTAEKVNDTFVFKSDIKVTGSITDEEREKLIRIAEACPVHKVLTHPIEINTTLV